MAAPQNTAYDPYASMLLLQQQQGNTTGNTTPTVGTGTSPAAPIQYAPQPGLAYQTPQNLGADPSYAAYVAANPTEINPNTGYVPTPTNLSGAPQGMPAVAPGYIAPTPIDYQPTNPTTYQAPNAVPIAPQTTTPTAPAAPINYGTGASGANNAMLAWLNQNATGGNFGGIDPQISAFNQQYGLGTGSGLSWYPGKNIVAASGGGYFAVGPDGTWGYNVGDSQGGANPPGAPGGGAIGAAATLPYGAGAPFAAASNPNTPGQGNVFDPSNPLSGEISALEQQLMGTATGSISDASNPNLTINPNDPIIMAQVNAYRDQLQQADNTYLSGLAESAGPNSNITAETRAGQEQVGQGTAAYQAQLMGTELAARRAEVQSALSGASGLLTNEQQMQLQQELQQLTLAQQAYQNGQTNLYNNNALALQYGG